MFYGRISTEIERSSYFREIRNCVKRSFEKIRKQHLVPDHSADHY